MVHPRDKSRQYLAEILAPWMMMTVKMTVRVIADNHSQTALKAQDNVMYLYSCLNQFQSSAAFRKETSHWICTANQMNDWFLYGI